MASLAEQVHNISTDEVRNVSVDMSALLEDDEVLTGIPGVECSADLTVTNQQRNGAAITINGAEVAANKAVQFTITGSTPGRYVIEIVCSTDGSQTVEGRIILYVKRTAF